MTGKILWFLVWGCIFALAMGGCAARGPVTGTLKVNGEIIPIKHVYALQYDALEEILDNPELRVVLTDKEVLYEHPSPPHYVFDTFGPINNLAREGKVYGIQLELDPRDPLKGFSCRLFYPPKVEGQTLASFSYSGTKPAFKKLKISADRAVGEIAYVFEQVEEDVPGFEFNISFDTPILREEKVTEKLEGPKALSSPQVQAFLKFAQACCRADLKEISGAASARELKELEALKKQIGEMEFKKMMAWPAPEKLKKQIRKVIVRGKRAWIFLEMEGEKVWQIAIQENGVWKID